MKLVLIVVVKNRAGAKTECQSEKGCFQVATPFSAVPAYAADLKKSAAYCILKNSGLLVVLLIL